MKIRRATQLEELYVAIPMLFSNYSASATDFVQYILPKMSKPLPKRQKLAPGAERSLTVALKSLRNPPLDITLSAQSPLLSVLDLKTQVAKESSIPVSAIRILHKKKPVGDAKVLKDLVGDEDASVEFSIMVIGGAAAVGSKSPEERTVDPETAQPAQGASGREVLGTEDFWNDLKGFLVQRLRDEAEGEKLFGTFKKAYDGR